MLGPFKVGDGARIAANSVVLTEIPENATAVGVPARVVRIGEEKTRYADDVDQIHNIVDPMERSMEELRQRLDRLEHRLASETDKGERT